MSERPKVYILVNIDEGYPTYYMLTEEQFAEASLEENPHNWMSAPDENDESRFETCPHFDHLAPLFAHLDANGLVLADDIVGEAY